MGIEGARPVAVVTGHSGAVGGAVASELRKRGYYVIGISRRSRPECADIEYPADLSRPGEEFLPAVEKLIEGCGKLKVLVYAAGVALVKRFEEVTREEYEHVLRVNLSSAVFLSQLSFRLMRKTGEGGAIIFVSSQVALPGCAQAYNSIYSLTKSGFNGLVRSLAKEGGPQIRVNAVCPGDFRSDLAEEGKRGFCELSGMTAEQYDLSVVERSAIKRWLEPAEVADAVCFLISTPAMTGVLLNVSGGSLTS